MTSPEHDVIDLLRVVKEDVLLERLLFLCRNSFVEALEVSLSWIFVVVEVD